MKKSLKLVVAVVCAFAAGCAGAQDFPSRPVRMIVASAPGGGADILARAIGQVFSRTTGQQMVVENRPGANGRIGTAACKNAPPDGYTYCLTVSDVLVINPLVFKTVPYDAERDFTVVAPVASVVLALVTNSSVPAKDVKELAAWSFANKGKANFASWGVGGAAHLFMAQFNISMNGGFTHVPYAGISQMVQAVASNEAATSLLFYGPIAQHLQAGTMKAVAVLGSERYAALPNVPTLEEQGFKFTPTVYYGVLAPTGVPTPVLARMNQLLVAATGDPEVLKLMANQGFVRLVESANAFSERLTRDRASWGPVARSLNLSLE